MNQRKIVLVEYFNTEPFLTELQKHQDQFELIRKIPSSCASHFEEGHAEIALIPVASYLQMKGVSIVSNYGICCNGEVATVVLFSNESKSQLTKIFLDSHSRTSVELLKIIVEQFWNLKVEFVRTDVNQIKIGQGEGVLMIGDKVFENDSKYNHKYDLGAIWKEQTGLPFVFAVWVSKDEISEEVNTLIEPILAKALESIPSIIKKLSKKNRWDVKSYFEKNIVYTIGEDGKKAIELFKRRIKSESLIDK